LYIYFEYNYHRAMEVHSGFGSITPHILNLDTKGVTQYRIRYCEPEKCVKTQINHE